MQDGTENLAAILMAVSAGFELYFLQSYLPQNIGI